MAVCVWDFTASCAEVTKDEMDVFVKKWCKKWCFQKEKGASGFEHWQGRVSLKVKERLGTLRKKLVAHWSKTSNAARNDDFYACKEDTRVDGPWKDSDPYVPCQIAKVTELKPWQEEIKRICERPDERSIHLVFDPKGCVGKSTIGFWLHDHGIARRVPPINDLKEMMGLICCAPTCRAYIFDMPRALKKEKMYQFWSAIEEIKNGYAYDTRYSFKEKRFDSPAVVVFTNTMPDLNLMSEDRWVIHTIVNDDLH